MRKPRRYSIKQIAAQAGVSQATVDRAVHHRGHVNPQTQQRIAQAVKELKEQELFSMPVQGRTVFIDVVMHAPARFCQAVRDAMNQQAVQWSAFRIKLRFHLFEDISVSDLRKQLIWIAQHGSHGVVLKVPNDPLMMETIKDLQQQGIPAVTLVTDLPESDRLLYCGMSNHHAGATAAYLMANWLPQAARSNVLVVLSNDRFQGEDERALAFARSLQQQRPEIRVSRTEGSFGMDERLYVQLCEDLKGHESWSGVYSVGGGNRAILQAFEDLELPAPVLIGHDLDRDNRLLLAQKRLQAVLYHDLTVDAQRSFQALLQWHRLIPETDLPQSKVEIITPYNLP